jgi:Domain of unknown function (DUF5710)
MGCSSQISFAVSNHEDLTEVGAKCKDSAAGVFFTVPTKYHHEAAENGAQWDGELQMFYAQTDVAIALLHGMPHVHPVGAPTRKKPRPQEDNSQAAVQPQTPGKRARDEGQCSQHASLAPKTPSPAKGQAPESESPAKRRKPSTLIQRIAEKRKNEAYFLISYDDREEAKVMGASWDAKRKLWFVH